MFMAKPKGKSRTNKKKTTWKKKNLSTQQRIKYEKHQAQLKQQKNKQRMARQRNKTKNKNLLANTAIKTQMAGVAAQTVGEGSKVARAKIDADKDVAMEAAKLANSNLEGSDNPGSQDDAENPFGW